MKKSNTKKVAKKDNAQADNKQSMGKNIEPSTIPFSDIGISTWNRSHGHELDKAYIEELAADIRKNKLLHPITLVKSDAEGPKFMILAGAHRFEALKHLGGEGEGLKPGEFTVRRNLTDADEKCLAISISENHHRRISSTYEMAKYVTRLTKEKHVDQGELGRMLGLRREMINRLLKLNECFDGLPDTWRQDLQQSPSETSKSAPRISLSHWYEAAGYFKEGRLTEDQRKILEEAYEQHLSSRATRNFLKGLKNPMDSESDNGAETPNASEETNHHAPKLRDPAAAPKYEAVVRNLQHALAHVGKDEAIAKMIEDVLQRLKAMLEQVNQPDTTDKTNKAA